MSESILQNILRQLKNNGCRLTEQRRIVIKIILAHKHDHMTVEFIYDHAKSVTSNISLTTVYRVVDFLKQNNFIRKVYAEDERYFYEFINPDEIIVHPHCVCRKCGKTINVLDSGILLQIAACRQKIAADYGFAVTSSNIIYYGICKKCLEALDLVSVQVR
ncbi:Fur family transcriptional regulator [Pectinatus frisingensis]|jgi:Fur family ferric uptake transcriptional regulator|uniref:Fur family transcriptional regulator n=1 Tax=Pectinatus frisingensis TaxID=865 RepID=UPI0015F7357F|nr:Fur family transcriptional regulator [Pectinatus frisingensis]